jgi:integrase
MLDLAIIHRPLVIPPALDGSAGANRAPSAGKQITADTDLAAVGLWLAEFHDSPHTFRSYRKEATRLLVWAIEVRGKALSSLTREDCLAYEAFLSHPPEHWNGASLPRRGDARRLVASGLSPASVRQAVGILSGLFTYLVNAGYLAGNPWALKRRKRKVRGRPSIERYLDQTLWDAVLTLVENEPRATPRAQQRYERDRWVLRLLYGTALRAAEAADVRAGDFTMRRGRWWLTVRGKGGVTDAVPISDALLADYARYRAFHGLPAAWAPSDRTL